MAKITQENIRKYLATKRMDYSQIGCRYLVYAIGITNDECLDKIQEVYSRVGQRVGKSPEYVCAKMRGVIKSHFPAAARTINIIYAALAAINSWD